jgi:hypothetical protein
MQIDFKITLAVLLPVPVSLGILAEVLEYSRHIALKDVLRYTSQARDTKEAPVLQHTCQKWDDRCKAFSELS